ncbi:hypothetical protein BgiBS90_023912 [Biomphalaria glabrata]|nr:hypothetical protein BgiBS90_023912 [Biomphalaria glabrata]
MQPPRSHHAATTQPPRSHHAVTTQPPRSHHAATTEPPRSHHAATTEPPRSHHAATTQPPRSHHAATMHFTPWKRFKGVRTSVALYVLWTVFAVCGSFELGLEPTTSSPATSLSSDLIQV